MFDVYQALPSAASPDATFGRNIVQNSPAFSFSVPERKWHYKSSPVAELGDRGHNRHGPKIEGLCPFSGGGGAGTVGSPSNTIAWSQTYLRTKWNLSPSSRLATTNIGRNRGAVPL